MTGQVLRQLGQQQRLVEPEDQIGMHAAAALVDTGELGGAEIARLLFFDFFA